jgi:RNA polymerase sigma factor (sigma-70 family)
VPLTPAPSVSRRLAEVNIRLADFIVRELRKTNELPYRLRDDARSEALVALVKASKHFKFLSGRKFSYYARCSMFNFVRKWLRRKETPHATVGVKLVRLSHDVVDRRSDDFESRENRDVALAAIAGLPKALGEALYAHAVEGWNYAQIARRAGVTRELVRLRVKRARKLVRERLETLS